MSPSSTVTANSITFDPHCYPPSSPPFLIHYPSPPFSQVQIDVEQMHGCGGSDKGSGDDEYSDVEKEKRRSLEVSRST